MRLKLRSLVVLIAVLAVILWAGLTLWSPTRRLGRLLRADQPVFVRREAASSLGRDIPFWEVDQAVSMLINAFDDPSPRVREYATVGLVEVGPRAERALSKLILVLNDEDRFVRFAAARTIGMILVKSGSAKQAEAVRALTRTLDDKDPEVRLAAAESLVELGEVRKAAGTLLAACRGGEAHLRQRARLIIGSTKAPRHFIAPLAEELRHQDSRRRDEALQTLQLIAAPEAVRSALHAAFVDADPEIHQWAAARLEKRSAVPGN